MKNQEDYYEKEIFTDLTSDHGQTPSTKTVSTSLQQTESLNHHETKSNKDIFEDLDIKCHCGNPVYIYCSSLDCKSHTAMCREESSKCSQNHPECINTIRPKHLHKLLNSKIIKDKEKIEATMKLAQKTIDKIIDQISEMKAGLEQRIKLFGLNKCQTKISEIILNSLKQTPEELENAMALNENVKKLNFIGSSFNEYDKQSGNKDDWVYDSIKGFEKIVIDTRKKVATYFEDVNSTYEQLHMKYAKNYPYLDYFKSFIIFREFQMRNTQNLEVTNLVAIMKKHLKYNSVQKLFEYKKIQNQPANFNHERFYEMIERKQNLLFLIKNKFHKVYGFFTTSMISAQNSDWNVDDKKLSFLFSTNLNISQTLANPNFSLKYDKKLGSIEVGNFVLEPGQTNCLLNNSNGAKLYFGSPDAKNQYPSAEIFLKRTQNTNNITYEIDYKKIHGEERKNDPGFKGSQINVLEIYAFNIAQSDNDNPISVQHVPSDLTERSNSSQAQTLPSQFVSIMSSSNAKEKNGNGRK